MFILQGSSRWLPVGAAARVAALLLAAALIVSPAAGTQDVEGAALSGTRMGAALSRAHIGAALSAEHIGAAPSEADSQLVRHGRIRLATGVEIHVAQTGPEDGVPVVLLHGFTDSWFSWSRVLERLPADVRAIVPTQRGHGESDRPVCCYQLGDFAADIVALLDALGIQRAHVVGHSMGGLVAQRFAIDSPERVGRLVIVGSAASARSDAVIEFNDVVQQLADPIDPAFIRDFQVGTTALPLPPAFLDRVVRESGKLPARIWRDVLGGLLEPEAAHDVSRITAPTLVVWGAQDALFLRASQDSLVAAIAGARFLVYPEAAHSPNWEIPDRLVEDVSTFLGVGGTRLPDAPDRFLELADVSLRYRDLGGAGDAVVLLHGYTNDIHTWDEVADSLRSDYRVIAVDLRGSGSSRTRRPDVRFGRFMAADVVALLDSLALPRAHLVGFSLGGLVAASVARAAPERVATLTLLAPPLLADSATLARALEPHVRDMADGRGLTSFFQWVYPRAGSDAVRRAAGRAVAANDSTALVEVARQMGGLVPDRMELRRIAAPTVIAVGTDDPFLEAGRRAAMELPGARLVLLSGGNHGATIARPSWIEAFRTSAERTGG